MNNKLFIMKAKKVLFCLVDARSVDSPAPTDELYSTEGLPVLTAVGYYTRIRFAPPTACEYSPTSRDCAR